MFVNRALKCYQTWQCGGVTVSLLLPDNLSTPFIQCLSSGPIRDTSRGWRLISNVLALFRTLNPSNGLSVCGPTAAQHGGDTDSLSSAQGSVTEQPVSPVIPKCLQKATTPPVTIKNFFKKTSDVRSASETGVCGTSEDAACSHSAKTSQTPSSSSKPQGTVTKPGSKRTFTSPTSQPAAKKTKQNSIMASFARQKSKGAEEKERELKCPICNKVFEVGTVNAEINQHVDNCLIDWDTVVPGGACLGSVWVQSIPATPAPGTLSTWESEMHVLGNCGGLNWGNVCVCARKNVFL